MSGKVSPTGGVSRVSARRRVSDAEIVAAQAVDRLDGTAAEDLRLIIEEAGEAGQVIYTVVDRRTGRVISRHTSEDMKKLSEDPSYTPGGVFDAKA